MSNENWVQQETLTGTVPVLASERQYGFWDLFLSTSGFAIATWCYTQGAYVAGILSFKQMLINIFCFNIIWVSVSCIPVFFAVRYGIDLWIWLRGVLGPRAVAILATVISMANFGWYAVDADLFASSLINLFAVFGVSLPAGFWQPVLGIVCVVLGTLVALGGPRVIKITSRVLVTALLVVGAVVVVLCFTAVPFSQMLNLQPPADPSSTLSPIAKFMISAEGNVAFAFSWSTQALVLPRLCKSESKGYWGTTLAYGVVAPFFVAAGGIMAYAMFARFGVLESDPTLMLSKLCGQSVALLSLMMVSFANIGTQGMGSYVNCMIVKSGLPKLSYRLLVILAMVYVSLLTVFGWVMEHFGAFISLAAYIQGPIIGMTVTDYLFIRKRKADLEDLYDTNEKHRYDFTRGFNMVSMAIILISFVSCFVIVYNPLTGVVKSPIFLVLTGSGWTAISAGIMYYAASRTKLREYMRIDR